MRWSHTPCALACGGHAAYGLESSGTFCFCLPATAASGGGATLHPAECATPCSTRPTAIERSRVHWEPLEGGELPCGGIEAVAVFDTNVALANITTTAACAEPAATPDAAPRRRLAERMRIRQRGRLPRALASAARGGGCLEIVTSCALSETRGALPRDVFVHASLDGYRPLAAAALLGSFDEGELRRRHKWRRPAALGTDCASACADVAYFAVGRGGSSDCLCADAPPARWRRDQDGLSGLKAITASPLPVARAAMLPVPPRRRTRP